jgi:hypothetical protein
VQVGSGQHNETSQEVCGMFGQSLESAVSRAALLLAGIAIGATFSKELRPVAKRAIRFGLTAGGAVQEAAAEAYERGQDLVAEARYEQEQAEAEPAASAAAGNGSSADRRAAPGRA